MTDPRGAGDARDAVRHDADAVEIYKLAMEEGLRRLQHQDGEVAIARTRLLQLVTVVTAATAFLVAAAFESTRSDRSIGFYIAAAVATMLYATLLIVVYRALRPLTGWIVETLPSVIVQDYGDSSAQPTPATLAETYRSLALHYEAYADSNERLLDGLRRQLSVSILLGGAQVTCWVVVAWLVA